MNTYVALFLIATFSSLVLTPLIRRACERFKLLDLPTSGRKRHSKAVPRLGGVALYLSCGIALSMLPLVDNLLTQTLRQHRADALLVLIPATLVLFLGIYDDLRGSNAAVKFAALGLIAALFYAMGGRVEALSVPFVGPVHLPSTISFLLTVFWLVGISNAFNLIDGIDGLASGAALFSSMVILVVSFTQGAALTIVVALVLCGALAGFLRYNFNPASIFLGDSGALFVGFTLAALSVLGTQKATTAVAVAIPALAFGLPVVDTAVTMVRRLISRKPIFEGDDEHIHHMLLARGWSQRQTALVLYGVCALFGLLAMLFARTGSHSTGFVLFVVTVVVLIAVGHLRYHEVEELRAGVKRTVADRRVRVANNIRVRRASRALTKAHNLEQVVEAVSYMLESEAFAYACMQLEDPTGKSASERIRGRSHIGRGLEFHNGRILWSWSKNGENADLVASGAYWCLRMPLTNSSGQWGWMNLYRAFDADPLLIDTNYVSGLFRRELSEAAERIFIASSRPEFEAAEYTLAASPGRLTN
ncbi:MAG TPA: MraY family glycosyltransferase [Pyrinomonadaceae bacterium]|nr:MraY family glycosyltransferase [Pyrinomonadaceae bacterium]